MTEGSFAAFVPQPVLDQIKAREEKWGKEHKTAEELEVIHGNTVWCVLRSGVDAPENEKDRFTLPTSGSDKIKTIPTYAIAGVLGGDNLQSSGAGKRAGVQVTDNSDNTFYNITSQGHKPRPGITGFTVKTLDTWGMILEANISFKVWSRDDLEQMDLIYFKPGYPALFEWGHTLYFRPDGSVCKTPKLMVSNEEFFKGGEFKDLDEKVLKAREEDCNREAVFGYITNFSWSFNHDGSFDCTLKVLSKGAVLESLRMSSKAEAGEADEGDEVKWWTVSDYHRLLKALNYRYTNKSSGYVDKMPIVDKRSVTTLEYLKSIPETAQALQEDTGIYHRVSIKRALQQALETKKSSWGINEDLWKDSLKDAPAIAVVTTAGRKKGHHSFYITLQTLLHIINCFQEPDSPGLYFETISDARFGHAGFKYLDSKGNTVYLPSLNPFVALKPSQLGSGDFEVYQPSGGKNPGETGFTDCMRNFSECGSLDRILNIWVNFDVFVSLVEKKIGENNQHYIQPALEELLQMIQKAFGNVNSFGLHGNAAVSGVYEVVDRSFVCFEKDRNKFPVLNITGLYNTVTDLKITSDVSQDMVNEMCIAAVSPRESTPGAENADECLIFWGENCKARWYNAFKPSKDSKSNTKSIEGSYKAEEKEQKAREQWLKDLKKFYLSFQNSNVDRKVADKKIKDSRGSDNVKVTDELLNAIVDKSVQFQLEGEKYYKNQVKRDLENKAEFHAGLIPYKTTITLLGISRLYIGNTFKIRNGILPRKYDDWGYLITGIEHSVRNNQWFTTLTTNYFPVFSDEIMTESKPTGGLRGDNQYSTTNLHRSVDEEEINSTCDYRTAFKSSGIFYGKSCGLCARYTANWARTWVYGKAVPLKGAVWNEKRQIYIPAIAANGNANDMLYRTTLALMGYRIGRVVTVTGSDIANLRAGSDVDGVTIKEGDVITYWNNKLVDYGHTCFYDGRHWCSSWNQNSAYVYKFGGTFNLVLMSAPPKHQDWMCE